MGIIRLLLALCVVVGHANRPEWYPIVRPEYAVEMFFIISGFYMALVLNEKYLPLPSAANAYRLFIQSRALRLFPVYLAVLLVTVVVQSLWARAAGSPDTQAFGSIAPAVLFWKHAALNPASAGVLAGTNLLMLGQDAMMYLQVNTHTGALGFTPDWGRVPLAAWRFLLLPQGWSLGIEALFYLVAPLVVRRSVPVIAGAVVLSLAVRTALRHFGLVNDPWNSRFFPSELHLFFLGALGYRAYRWLRAKQAFRLWQGVAALAAALVMIAFCWHTRLWHHPDLPELLFAAAVPLIFALSKTNKLDRWVGELSYPLYVVHILVIQAVRHAGYKGMHDTVLCSLAAAVLLMFAVDQPVERLRQGWIARRKGLSSSVRPQPAAVVR